LCDDINQQGVITVRTAQFRGGSDHCQKRDVFKRRACKGAVLHTQASKEIISRVGKAQIADIADKTKHTAHRCHIVIAVEFTAFSRAAVRVGIILAFRRAVVTSDSGHRFNRLCRQALFRYVLTFSRAGFLILRSFFAGYRTVGREFITDIATQLVTDRRTILSFGIFNTLYGTIVTAVTFYVAAYIRTTFAVRVDFTFIRTVLAGLAGYIPAYIGTIRAVGIFFAFIRAVVAGCLRCLALRVFANGRTSLAVRIFQAFI
jgi:hypothetical protein